MAANLRHKSSRKFRSGSALVIIGVILALAAVVFFLQKLGVFEGGPGDPNKAGIMPWKEWTIRQKLAQEGQTQSATEEPDIAESYNPSVRMEGVTKSKGKVRINISGNGVIGRWHGHFYSSNKRAIQIMSGDFSGFYCPDHITDENGNEDTSKLYYLCKGGFLYQETGEQIVKHRAGDIYIRTWVNEDKSIFGRMYITSDEKNFHEFTFKGIPSKSQELIF